MSFGRSVDLIRGGAERFIRNGQFTISQCAAILLTIFNALRNTEGTTIPNAAEPEGIVFEDWYGGWNAMIESLEEFTKETSSEWPVLSA